MSIAKDQSVAATLLGGTTVNFQSGIVDWANPLTWPIIVHVLQSGGFKNTLDNITNTFSSKGLGELFGDPNMFAFAGVLLDPILGAFNLAVTPLAGLADAVFTPISESGLGSVDAYVGHANVGLVPAVSGAEVPVLSIVSGPPYPQILAQGGTINAFAAEYESLWTVNLSVMSTIEAPLAALNLAIDAYNTALDVLINALTSTIGLANLLPANAADLLASFHLPQLKLDGDFEVHAVLWHGVPVENSLGNVTWQKVTDISLGDMPILGTSISDAFSQGIGSIVNAGVDIASNLLSIIAGKTQGAPETPTVTPFNAGKIDGLSHPVAAGDYLVVQFTLAGDDLTLFATVGAPNAMASVAIS